MTFGTNLPNLQTGDKTTIAAILSLIAAISFSSSTVFSKRALRNVGFELGTYLRFLISAVILILIVVIMGDYDSFFNVSKNQWIIFFIIAFTTGGAAIFLYYYGLKKITASTATICELAFPLTAVILDYLIHGNLLSAIQWIGVIILILSIIKVSALHLVNK